MTIKAIETVYNGYRFRSRLEARWAMFFDALGIKYRYEPQGFSIDGVWYLPDFWLPDQKWFIEIKPDVDIPEDDIKKIRLLDDNSMNLPAPYQAYGVIVLQGLPDDTPGIPGITNDGNVYKFIKMVGLSTRNISLFSYISLAVKKAKQTRFEFGEKG